jgi:hypothetical protein
MHAEQQKICGCGVTGIVDARYKRRTQPVVAADSATWSAARMIGGVPAGVSPLGTGL